MHQSVMKFGLILLFSLSGFAQAKGSANLDDLKSALATLNLNLRAETSAAKRIELIEKSKKSIETRINEIAADVSVPYETVEKYYRLGDQLIVLGMLRAQNSTKMTSESCLRARGQLSVSGINQTEDKNVLPSQLKDVAQTIQVICK